MNTEIYAFSSKCFLRRFSIYNDVDYIVKLRQIQNLLHYFFAFPFSTLAYTQQDFQIVTDFYPIDFIHFFSSAFNGEIKDIDSFSCSTWKW